MKSLSSSQHRIPQVSLAHPSHKESEYTNSDHLNALDALGTSRALIYRLNDWPKFTREMHALKAQRHAPGTDLRLALKTQKLLTSHEATIEELAGYVSAFLDLQLDKLIPQSYSALQEVSKSPDEFHDLVHDKEFSEIFALRPALAFKLRMLAKETADLIVSGSEAATVCEQIRQKRSEGRHISSCADNLQKLAACILPVTFAFQHRLELTFSDISKAKLGNTQSLIVSGLCGQAYHHLCESYHSILFTYLQPAVRGALDPQAHAALLNRIKFIPRTFLGSHLRDGGKLSDIMRQMVFRAWEGLQSWEHPLQYCETKKRAPALLNALAEATDTLESEDFRQLSSEGDFTILQPISGACTTALKVYAGNNSRTLYISEHPASDARALSEATLQFCISPGSTVYHKNCGRLNEVSIEDFSDSEGQLPRPPEEIVRRTMHWLLSEAAAIKEDHPYLWDRMKDLEDPLFQRTSSGLEITLDAEAACIVRDYLYAYELEWTERRGNYTPEQTKITFLILENSDNKTATEQTAAPDKESDQALLRSEVKNLIYHNLSNFPAFYALLKPFGVTTSTQGKGSHSSLHLNGYRSTQGKKFLDESSPLNAAVALQVLEELHIDLKDFRLAMSERLKL